MGSSGSGTYAALTGAAFTGAITSKQADGSAITAKPSTDTSTALINWVMDTTAGYLLHFTTGTSAADPAACIGIGVDNGGRGVLIANKKTGLGLTITQQSSITSATAYGMWGSQQSTLAPLMRLEQTATGVAPLLDLYAITGATSGQKLQRWLTADLGTIGDVDANTGRFSFNIGLATFGNNALATDVQINLNSAVGKNRDIYWQTGGSNRWTLRVMSNSESGSNAGSDMQLIARTDAGATLVVPLTIRRSDGRITLGEACNLQFGTTTGTKIGTASSEKIGFYGATPIVRPSGVAVDAAGIHAALVSLGLIAA